jgi:hypothetical protein
VQQDSRHYYSCGQFLALRDAGLVKQADALGVGAAALGLAVPTLFGVALYQGHKRFNEEISRLRRLKTLGTLGGGALGAGAEALIGHQADKSPGLGAVIGGLAGAGIGREVTPRLFF